MNILTAAANFKTAKILHVAFLLPVSIFERKPSIAFVGPFRRSNATLFKFQRVLYIKLI